MEHSFIERTDVIDRYVRGTMPPAERSEFEEHFLDCQECLDQLELALDELPEEQREVFVAHELDGRSFKELAAETGVSVNTLLSRKRYAVLHLRDRLQSIYDEFTKS